MEPVIFGVEISGDVGGKVQEAVHAVFVTFDSTPPARARAR